MRQHHGSDAGYEMVAAHQTQLRAERAHDRTAQQSMTEADPASGLRARVRGILLHTRMASALVICVPLLYALNASHVAAQRTPSQAATGACAAAAPSASAAAPQPGDNIVRFPRNEPIPR